MPNRKNWSQARHETDSGKTHDKVDYPDPAAAPLGTDEEAGGARTPPDEIGDSVRRRKSVDAKRSASKNPHRKDPG
ncbi:MAG: hypothetical protein KY410_07990 [Proteobacteria bacterium]|nr:hypothetical protein [Pseudomonadota bacterium]